MLKYIIALILLLVVGAIGYQSTQTPGSSIESEQERARDNKLNRSNQGLSEFPNDILSMRSLAELNLSHNNLSGALPAEIRFLNRLRVLDISNNDYTGLPAEVGQLRELRILNVANNHLTGLPLEIGNLSELEILNLSGNDVSEIDLEKIRAALPPTVQIIR